MFYFLDQMAANSLNIVDKIVLAVFEIRHYENMKQKKNKLFFHAQLQYFTISRMVK